MFTLLIRDECLLRFSEKGGSVTVYGTAHVVRSVKEIAVFKQVTNRFTGGSIACYKLCYTHTIYIKVDSFSIAHLRRTYYNTMRK